MKDCGKCIYRKLCYANCDAMDNRYEDIACFRCNVVSCPEKSECEYYEEKEGAEMSKSTTKKYIITLIGCDDQTDIPIGLTEDEFELVEKISKKSKEISTYGCMPIMGIVMEK